MILAQQNRINPRTTITPKQLESMGQHINNHQQLLSSIIIQLLNLIITTDGVHWFAAKPLLALIFISRKEFTFIQQLIINSQMTTSQPDDQRGNAIVKAFNGLMSDIQVNVESDNREKFTTNVTAFRSDMKQYLDLNSFYKAVIQFTKE